MSALRRRVRYDDIHFLDVVGTQYSVMLLHNRCSSRARGIFALSFFISRPAPYTQSSRRPSLLTRGDAVRINNVAKTSRNVYSIGSSFELHCRRDAPEAATSPHFNYADPSPVLGYCGSRLHAPGLGIRDTWNLPKSSHVPAVHRRCHRRAR